MFPHFLFFSTHVAKISHGCITEPTQHAQDRLDAAKRKPTASLGPSSEVHSCSVTVK